jgi:hypothetical protein
MMFETRSGRGRGRTARAAFAAAVAVGLVAAAPVVAHAATMSTLFVSPTGSGTACSSAAPCSLTQAQASVRALDGSMSGDIVVQLAGGVYRLSSPLVFSVRRLRAATATTSSGRPRPAPARCCPAASRSPAGPAGLGATTSGPRRCPPASTPGSSTSTARWRRAPRSAINRSDVQITNTGMTIANSALNYLASLPQQNRIEVESQNSFTDRFAPVRASAGSTITMQQPAWNNNNWGYDTLAKPVRRRRSCNWRTRTRS